MASSPTYDPNLIRAGRLREDREDQGTCGDASAPAEQRDAGPLSAGLDVQDRHRRGGARHRRVHAELGFYDPGYCTEYGKRVSNSAPRPRRRRGVRQRQLLAALEHSINAVFCNDRASTRAETILDYAKRFGFYSRRRSRRRRARCAASGLYNKGRSSTRRPQRRSTRAARVRPGAMLVTPLQMALVAATIANSGVEPKPYLVQRIVAPDGSTSKTTARRSGARSSRRRPPS
jgi:cell division protein FtsI/penicillin-binding protein 2